MPPNGGVLTRRRVIRLEPLVQDCASRQSVYVLMWRFFVHWLRERSKTKTTAYLDLFCLFLLLLSQDRHVISLCHSDYIGRTADFGFGLSTEDHKNGFCKKRAVIEVERPLIFRHTWRFLSSDIGIYDGRHRLIMPQLSVPKGDHLHRTAQRVQSAQQPTRPESRQLPVQQHKVGSNVLNSSKQTFQLVCFPHHL